MAPWAGPITDILWRNAIAAIPLAGFVALFCRYAYCRPGTRHILWVTVLGSLVMPPLIPPMESPPVATEFAASEEADSVLAAHNSNPDPNPQPVPIQNKNIPPAESRHRESAIRDSESPIMNPPERVLVHTLPHSDSCDHFVENDIQKVHDAGIPVEPSQDDRLTLILPPLRIAQLPHPSNLDATILDEAPPERSRPLSDPKQSSTNLEPPAPAEPAAHSDDSIAWIQSVWMSWVAGLLLVRDALGQLSPIPVSLWITGTAAFLLFQLVLCWRVVRRIRRGKNASADTHAIAWGAARELGLRRVPQILMVDEAISPMIWPGRRLQLIIPRPLWNDLDHGGRRAVVIHELAHLRRRDHWWCWLDLLIGGLFWWNPLVWWIRSRLRAEAEACCDAWVTWLLPRDRRAYALALLTTRQYVSDDPTRRAVLGRAILSENAKDFARRITMVMTRTDAPRTTWSTFLLAAIVLAFGWAATPAQSCDKNKKHKHTAPASAPEPQLLHLPSHAPTPIATAPVAVLASGADHGDGNDEVDRLEERMDRLEERLQRVTELLEERLAGARSDADDRDHFFRSDRAERPARSPRAIVAPRATDPPSVYAHGISGGKFDRSYHLSGGKLDALTQLMIRQDVPVLVAPSDDEISVNGDAATHEIFKRFVGLIGEEEWRAYELEEGKLDAMYELMVRDDVPVYISRKGDAINVKGTPAQHEIFKAFVDLISGRHGADNRVGVVIPDADGSFASAQRFNDQQPDASARQRELAAAAAQRQRAFARQAARAEREAQRSMKRKQEASRRQADKLERKAREDDRKRELREREAAGAHEDARGESKAHAAELEVRNAELADRVKALRNAAEAARAQADQMREARQDRTRSKGQAR